MQIEFYHHPEIKIVNYNYLENPKLYRTVNSRPNGISVYIIISIFTIFVYFYIQHTALQESVYVNVQQTALQESVSVYVRHTTLHESVYVYVRHTALHESVRAK